MSSAEDDPEMTFYRHYSIIRDNTSGSHVVQFGTLELNSESIMNFLGAPRQTRDNKSKLLVSGTKGRVRSRDVRLHYFMMKELKSGEYSKPRFKNLKLWKLL